MLAASLGFACMGVCVKLAAVRYAIAEIVFWRSVVAVCISAVFMHGYGLALRSPQWRWQIARGSVGFAALLLYFSAIGLLPLATAVTLNYTSAIFFALFLIAGGSVRVRGPFLAVLLVGFVGIVLLLKPVVDQSAWLGGLYGLGSGVCAGLAYYSVRLLGRRGEHEVRTVFYFSLVSVIGGGVWVLGVGLTPIDLEGVALLAGVGLFATFAQLAMTRSYRRGKTMVSASLSYTAVPFASLFGIVLWGETLDLSSVAGMALIVLGGIAATQVARSNPAEQD
jgi:S-adenosylmethionine uptake transporter